jgi:phospholipid/cholesterol/gamma-HCH transport system permease protein
MPGVSAWQILVSGDRLELVGELRLADGPAIWRSLRAATEQHAPRTIDVSRATVIDGAVMSMVAEVMRGTGGELVGASPRIAQIGHLYLEGGAQLPQPPHERAIARIGDAATRLGLWLVDSARFTGDLVIAAGAGLRHRRAVDWRSLANLVERAGADGVPIVVLLNFLIGFVGAFQSTIPLRQFGANIYVADIVGISVTRELSPLITAFIIAGRSGAAFAAELATMRVSEEVDALRTMGIDPHAYLVIPRVLALALVAPALTLLGDVAGVLGGLAVGVTSLNLTSAGFIAELRTIVVASDIWTGLAKSVVFAIAIGLIACRRGLAARGAAAGVGRSTTSTVVACLFSIVIIDALVTMLFREFGL